MRKVVCIKTVKDDGMTELVIFNMQTVGYFGKKDKITLKMK